MPSHQPNDEKSKLIDASPTKDFFISMIVRDIELEDAIADLVDNCVDGARRIRPNGKYDDLWVRVEVSQQAFRIADNCGGISVDLARNYAFRFGRPPGMKQTKHSVGQFGIGMKRALFKMGGEFSVESTTTTSCFLVKVDVEEWRQEGGDGQANGKVDAKQDRWTFEFKELREDIKVPVSKTGTTITITQLNPGVASEFDLENFQTKLANTLEAKHQFSIENGLAITLNKMPLKFKAAELLQASDLKPAYRELSPQGNSKKTPVTVKLYVGIADSDPDAGGWYVFCNGRQVLRADQTERTGWGENKGVTIPKYHNQFARFRGYAFFDCDDASLLPWNTSKTDVALDSPLFQSTRQQMIAMARNVIDFLNKLKQENDLKDQTGKTPLLDQINKAQPADLDGLKRQLLFAAPKIPYYPPPPQTKSISYRKPIDQVAKARRALKATSLREIGERTFDYFYKAECGS